MGKVYGYARVSTGGQDLTVQRDALMKAGVKKDLIFAEKISGTKREGREKLAMLLGLADEGDTIVVTRIDRLARSMHDLQTIAHELKQKHVSLRATEQPIDTSTAAGKAFFDMLGVFAEFETNLRRERQAEGIAKAKRQGVYRGGVVRIDRSEVSAALERGLGPAKTARELGISRRQVYRIMEELAQARGPRT
jgi:DNA invertase Pin-like site-specific DNA recombinase